MTSEIVIIHPPTIDWHWMKQRPQHLMEQFSFQGFEVYYCNKTQSRNHSLTEINPNLKIVHNNYYLVNEIIPWLKTRGKKIVLWVSWPSLYPSLHNYLADYVIFDYIDDFSEWKQYLGPMVSKANLIITTSKVLLDEIQAKFPDKPNYLIANGCDLNHFKPNSSLKTNKPKEFIHHQGPIITYSGAWAKWIDQELVHKIARTFKNAFIVIIGKELNASINTNIPNLKYLGFKSYAELPIYLQHSTLCIIPFLIEQITLAANPVKMYEYLASGKPVVSTDIPEARNIPGVHIGQDHDRYLQLIGRILQKEIQFNHEIVYQWLDSHTWEERLKHILEVFNDHLICT